MTFVARFSARSYSAELQFLCIRIQGRSGWIDRFFGRPRPAECEPLLYDPYMPRPPEQSSHPFPEHQFRVVLKGADLNQLDLPCWRPDAMPYFSREHGRIYD